MLFAFSIEILKFPCFVFSNWFGLIKCQPLFWNFIANIGIALNFVANVVNCFISSEFKYFFVSLMNLHSIASRFFLLLTSISGDGNGVDPDPALLITPQFLLLNICMSSLSALVPFFFI